MMAARPGIDDMRAAIAARYRAATPEDIAAGMAWYPETGRWARRLARAHGTTPARVATAAAAMSPRVQWARCQYGTAELVAGRRPTGFFGRSIDKAITALQGGRVNLGPKTGAFKANILGNYALVTVDVWAARAAGHRAPATAREYANISAAYVLAAGDLGLAPAALQAIVWVVERGRP